VPTYAFLTDEWIEAAKRIRAEYADKVPPPPVMVKMNLIVKDVPFGDGKVLAHLDTSTGEPEVDVGHLDTPDLTISSAYDTIKAILVEGDVQEGMRAFMTGEVTVDGDITKLMALQQAGLSGAPDPQVGELTRRIREITA
jgi:putative sterol carrier protein